jgi:hypothetical protein
MLSTDPADMLLQENTSIFQRNKICLLLTLPSCYFCLKAHNFFNTFCATPGIFCLEYESYPFFSGLNVFRR